MIVTACKIFHFENKKEAHGNAVSKALQQQT